MMTRILVTGGSGFIGANFIHYMLKNYENYRIINFDQLTYAGNQDNLKSVEDYPQYQFIYGDITNKESVESVMNGIDLVVHFAAESHVDRSIEDASVFVKTNVVGTHVLLDTAMKAGIKKFIHISTDEVYGSLSNEGFFTEESPYLPNSPYSASKASSDLLARAYFKTYQFPVVITHCSNNYGPYQFPEKLIPLMITYALNDKKLPVYGTGMNVRDWLYVEDHCRAIDIILQNGRLGETYNIGGNNEWNNIDVVKMILKALSKPETLIEFVEDRQGHDWRYAIDASKMKDELGWSPQVCFEAGLKKTIDWYLKNAQWIERVQSGAYCDRREQE